jgi:carbon storage regulator
MLVLSRKPLQSIMIGPDIKITVVKVERNQVRIGIEAPRDITILRDELADAVGERSADNREQPSLSHVISA